MLPATRAVFRELLRRELEERWRGSLLGAAWVLLLPVLQLGVLAWVFGQILPTRAGDGQLPYAAFLALGLWPWNLFATATSRGVTALTDNAALIGKVAVPHGLYIDTRVAGAVVVEAAGFAAVLFVLWVSGIALSARGLPVVVLALAVVVVITQTIEQHAAIDRYRTARRLCTAQCRRLQRQRAPRHPRRLTALGPHRAQRRKQQQIGLVPACQCHSLPYGRFARLSSLRRRCNRSNRRGI